MILNTEHIIHVIFMPFGKATDLFDLLQDNVLRYGVTLKPTTVNSKEEYLAEIHGSRRHLVLSCYQNGGGFDMFSALKICKSVDNPPPFIVFSEENDQTKVEKSFINGAADFFTPSEIPKIVPAILREANHYVNEKNNQSHNLEHVIRNLKFQNIFDSHHSVMLMISAVTGEIIDANEAAIKFYGKPIEDFKNLSIYSLTVEPSKNLLEILGDEQGKDKSGIFRHKTTNGIKYVEIYSTYISGNGGILFSIIHDVTERQLNRKELSQTLKTLKIRNEELDNFNYKVSHDLRAPLCSVRGLINVMKMGVTEDEFSGYVELIESRVNKLDAFILDVLSHSKNLHAPVESVRVDLYSIIEQSIEDLQYLSNSKKIKIKTTSDSGQFIIYSDPLRISNIIRNLLSNAITFLDSYKDENFVKISLETDEINYTLLFEDNGIGIDPMVLPKIFDMFYRGHESSENSGIGLYIVERAVEKLQGTISVVSKPQEGTFFKISIPKNFSRDVNVV